jgi:hypothetical protein
MNVGRKRSNGFSLIFSFFVNISEDIKKQIMWKIKIYLKN